MRGSSQVYNRLYKDAQTRRENDKNKKIAIIKHEQEQEK